jgi:hypothetical protein
LIRARIFFVFARRQRLADAQPAAEARAARLEHDQHEATERRNDQRDASGELINREVVEFTHFLRARFFCLPVVMAPELFQVAHRRHVPGQGAARHVLQDLLKDSVAGLVAKRRHSVGSRMVLY